MPHTDNYRTVVNALTSRSLADLLGTVETIDVEYKSEQYRFSQPEQVVEFAKDVCSMLNAEGGVIVIGVRTSRFQTVSSEVATGQIPMKLSKFNASEMFQFLVEHTYPSITADQVDISFVEDSRVVAGRMGLIVIHTTAVDSQVVPVFVRTAERWGVPALIYARRTSDCQTNYPLDDLAVRAIT